MKTLQADQVPVNHAINEAAADCAELFALARRHRAAHPDINQPQTIRHWQPSAGTYCYQTHIAIANQSAKRLAWLTDVFFNASNLPSQPWYPQFSGGECSGLSKPTAPGVSQHQLSVGRFDLGLPSPRYYRQLLSLAQPDEHTSVIAARSVSSGSRLPTGAHLAFTLTPNGEVLHFDNGCLHWHHICCTPGAAVLPGRLDRWLINTLRRLGLDSAERNTYRSEAEQLRDWLQSSLPGALPVFTWTDPGEP